MVGLIILGIIVAIIAVILLVPVGADIGYENGEMRLSAKVCGMLLQLLPKKPPDETKPKKEKKPKKKKEKKAPDPNKPPKEKKKLKLEFNLDEILGLVKAVLRGFGKFGKVQVDRFMLHYTAGGGDPYATAMTYNYVNAALSSLAPICREKFNVKSSDVWTDVDFSLEKMKVDFGLCIVIRLGQVFRMAFAILFGALGILIKNKFRLTVEKFKRRKEEKAERKLLPAEGETQETDTKDNTEQNIQENERTDSNG